MMYGSWDLAQQTIFCHSGLFFALLPTPSSLMDPENQNFQKKNEQKAPENVIIWQT